MSKKPSTRGNELTRRVVAGLVLARCSCCTEQQELATHDDLDAARMLCPVSGQVYLDRGDGVFELQQGERISPMAAATAQSRVVDEPDVLSDRPQRTDEKARISLERASAMWPST